jgi:transcriptional regulator with XRE-family HTH domain
MSKIKTIAEYVKEARVNNGLTQVQFAKALKTKQNNISRIENGKRNLPKNKVKDLAKLTKVSEKTIFKAWLSHYEKYGSEIL